MDPGFRAPFANVNRWFVTIVNQPQFKKVLGEVKLCETMATFDGELHSLVADKILVIINGGGWVGGGHSWQKWSSP